MPIDTRKPASRKRAAKRTRENFNYLAQAASRPVPQTEENLKRPTTTKKTIP